MQPINTGDYVAGIDVGGTNVRCAIALTDEPESLLVHRIAPTPLEGGPEAFLDHVHREITECARELGLPENEPAAVGCSTPGIVEAGTGIVRLASNLYWKDLPLADLLEARFGVRAVVENDVRAAAVAEQRHGAGHGTSTLVFFTVSTGVSAGIIADGNLLRGSHNAAGELAYLIPEPQYLDEDWGPNGCLESNAGGVGIARLWANGNGGPADPTLATEVFRLAREGNERAKRLVDRAADYLAQAAVAIGTLIDPEKIVLGGSIAMNEPRIVERIRNVTSRTLPCPPDVVLASLGGDAPLIGALTLAASLVQTVESI